ncbi:MAG TPA: hypothetical protein VD757_01835 [Candidatus Nitrosocosmicus sp.]|nr:hypothetical protein [Candidatus Nitrosocosmicus sp.]
MWGMMLLSYTVVTIIDAKPFSTQNNKGHIFIYIALMIISCTIGIANGYVSNMPSPADSIRNIVLSIIGG